MAQQIASLYADIGAKTDGFEKGAASVKSGLSGLATNAAVVTAALTIMHESFNMAREGAELQRLRNSGEETARQFGGNMDLIIQKVKEASNGTVAEMDIIKSANKAMMLGLGADADQMANLMEVAAYRGRVMGLSTTQAFDDIVRGIGRASPMILDNLGIVVNANETYSTYAQKIGKTAGELTKAEKTQALLNAVLSEGNTMLAEAGGLADDNASKYERLTAMTKDLGDAMKETFSAGVIRFIYGQDEALNDLLETNKKMVVGNAEQAKKLKEIYEAEQAAAKATTERTSAVEDNTSAIEENIENVEELSKYNEKYLDVIGNVTGSIKDYEEKESDLKSKHAELLDEKKKLLEQGWWAESDAVQAINDKLAENEEAQAKNAEAFDLATKSRMLSMLEEQLAIDGLDARETEFLLQQGKEWGLYSDEAIAAMKEAQDKVLELIDTYNGVPSVIGTTFKISVEGAEALNIQRVGEKDYVPTPRRSNATGGTYMIPTSWGNERFPIGTSDTASGGELISITPKGKDPNAEVVAAIYATRLNIDELTRAFVLAAQQVSK